MANASSIEAINQFYEIPTTLGAKVADIHISKLEQDFDKNEGSNNVKNKLLPNLLLHDPTITLNCF